ncbi:deoxyguanosinetriphosphate triphosphohydrolase [Candidatus Pelagibacter sp.]|jgi:dGTPase|nr:deoxyguanosinetriphosphate triphosphohydrolase [Candidatus Pelagibacter sp.]
MNNYSNLALLKSKGRIFKETKSLYRTPFQRDRDRIIHSASFRRLKHKTQVFVNTEGDHYRTRITHSIEVAQIARSIARHLNLNDDLAETLSLAHDLGHTPFGHAGEDSLNECMSNFGGFDHNLQTLRIIMFLENKYLKFSGLNLTIETLDGLLKHNGRIKDLTLVKKLIGIKNFNNKINFTKSASLEAQISAISDDIAYNNHDIQDGIRAKMITLDELIEINFFKDIYKSHKKNIKNNNKDILIYQIIRDSIDLMVKNLIKNTINNLKVNKIKSINDIYKNEKPIVSFSNEYSDIEKEIRFFLRSKMYSNKKVLIKNNKGKKIIKDLFYTINKRPSKFLSKEQLKKDKHRAIADFISGMTDRFAIKLHKNI